MVWNCISPIQDVVEYEENPIPEEMRHCPAGALWNCGIVHWKLMPHDTISLPELIDGSLPVQRSFSTTSSTSCWHLQRKCTGRPCNSARLLMLLGVVRCVQHALCAVRIQQHHEKELITTHPPPNAQVPARQTEDDSGVLLLVPHTADSHRPWNAYKVGEGLHKSRGRRAGCHEAAQGRFPQKG